MSQVIGLCDVCGLPVRSQPGSLREVVGWEELRAAGGANKIMHRLETGRTAHFRCIEADQPALWG